MGLNGPTDYRRDRLGDGARWFEHRRRRGERRACRQAFFRLTDYPPEDCAHVPPSTLTWGAAGPCMCPRR